MLETIKYGMYVVKDFWSETLTTREREQIKYWMVLNSMLVLSPVSTFAHECGHAIMGSLFGLELLEFVVGFSGGHVSFEYVALKQLSLLQIWLVYVAGGVAESLMFYALGKKLFKGFYVYIISTLPYGLWEGLKGLIFLIEPSDAIRLFHMAILEPVILGSWMLAAGILTYKALFPGESN